MHERRPNGKRRRASNNQSPGYIIPESRPTVIVGEPFETMSKTIAVFWVAVRRFWLSKSCTFLSNVTKAHPMVKFVVLTAVLNLKNGVNFYLVYASNLVFWESPSYYVALS